MTIGEAIKTAMEDDDPMAVWFRPEGMMTEAYALKGEGVKRPDGTVRIDYTVVKVPSIQWPVPHMTPDAEELMGPWELVTPDDVYREIDNMDGVNRVIRRMA